MPVQRCVADNKPGWKWGEGGKCYTYTDKAGSDAAHAKAEKQGAAAHANMSLVLQLQTPPALCMANKWTPKDLVHYKKELVRVGHYIKASAGQAFEVTRDTLFHWAQTFRRWHENGNRVSIPVTHAAAGDPERNAGWVNNMFVEGDSLFGIMDLLNPELALTSDVSIYVPAEAIDGKGRRYERPIVHVALCTDPVIPGLDNFEKLSLSKGDSIMDKKVLAKLLGIAEDADDKLITSTIEALKKPAPVIAASQTVKAVDPVLVRVVAESRASKLNTLVNAGILNSAMKDIIEAKYVKEDALTLSLSRGGEDGFDLLLKVLTENKTVPLGERTGPQLLELANTRATQQSANPDLEQRREAAKTKPGWVVP